VNVLPDASRGSVASLPVDLREFIAQFQDHLAPKLDTYEQAIYLYVFRHSRLIGLDQVTLGFKSARSRMARGAGKKGEAMSLNTVYLKLASLQSKGCIAILRTTDAGRELSLRLPSEIPGLIAPTSTTVGTSLETNRTRTAPGVRRRGSG
jgi:hypothetical protein